MHRAFRFLIGLVILAILVFSSVSAGTENTGNVAGVLGYGLAAGKPIVIEAGAAGAAYADKRLNDIRHDENKRYRGCNDFKCDYCHKNNRNNNCQARERKECYSERLRRQEFAIREAERVAREEAYRRQDEQRRWAEIERAQCNQSSCRDQRPYNREHRHRWYDQKPYNTYRVNGSYYQSSYQSKGCSTIPVLAPHPCYSPQYNPSGYSTIPVPIPPQPYYTTPQYNPSSYSTIPLPTVPRRYYNSDDVSRRYHKAYCR